MAFLRKSPSKIFKELAEASTDGSQDEALFSGLARLAYDLHDIKQKLDDLKREVSNIS